MNSLSKSRHRPVRAHGTSLTVPESLRERKTIGPKRPTNLFVCAAILLLVGNQTALAQFLVTVQGNLKWGDGQNMLHNSRLVKVEIHSIDLLGNDTIESTDISNLDGFYQGSFQSVAPALLDVYVKVFASGPAGYVSPNFDPNTFVPVEADTYTLQTAPVGAVSGINEINANFTVANNAKRSLGVYDMMVTGSQFANDVRGAALPALPARFPHSSPPPDPNILPNTSFYSGSSNSIYILSGDRWDWDVIGHEYSHYLHNVDSLTNSPGGTHFLGTSNIPSLGKSPGVRLAWGEGVGNYMGVAMQQVNAVANKFPTNLQFFGDDIYRDSIDADITFSLELDTDPNDVGMAGEGEEVSVARILWDIGDPLGVQAGTHDRVARGHVQLYKDLVAARDRVRTNSGNNADPLASLHQVNDYYMNVVATDDETRVDYGAIYERYAVSPSPIGILADPNGALADVNNIVKFDWNRQNNNANDTFQLIVWNDDFTTRVLDFVVPGDVTTYQLNAAQIMQLKTGGHVGNDLNWAVIGSDLKDSSGTAYAGIASTGNYWSDAHTFSLVPEPMTLALATIAALFPVVTSRRRPEPTA